MVVVLVALVGAFFKRSAQPEIPSSPSPSASPTVALSPAKEESVAVSKVFELDGEYANSDGYSGDVLELRDGKYELSSHDCTDDRTVSKGSYQLEGADLVLTDSKRGDRRRWTVSQDKLIHEDGRYIYTLVKCVDADGHTIEGVQLYQPPVPVGFSTSPETISRGRSLYQASCVECHGPEGSGVAGKAANSARHVLAQKSLYKYGSDRNSLYRSVACGIEGTSMYPRDGILSEEDIWSICYYLESIQK